MMFTIIAFDVADDRKRYRVVKALRAYAVRVQKSVFEAKDLDEAAFLRMRSRIEKWITPETDNVRYYRLCGPCSRRTSEYGKGTREADTGDAILVVSPRLPEAAAVCDHLESPTAH